MKRAHSTQHPQDNKGYTDLSCVRMLVVLFPVLICHRIIRTRNDGDQHNERGNRISKAAAPQTEQCTEYTQE